MKPEHEAIEHALDSAAGKLARHKREIASIASKEPTGQFRIAIIDSNGDILDTYEDVSFDDLDSPSMLKEEIIRWMRRTIQKFSISSVDNSSPSV